MSHATGSIALGLTLICGQNRVGRMILRRNLNRLFAAHLEICVTTRDKESLTGCLVAQPHGNIVKMRLKEGGRTDTPRTIKFNKICGVSTAMAA